LNQGEIHMSLKRFSLLLNLSFILSSTLLSSFVFAAAPSATYQAATIGVAGGTGGTVNIYIRVAVPGTGSRSMSLWLNGARIGTVTANFTTAPRPTGIEVG